MSKTEAEKRAIALERAKELRGKIEPFLEAQKDIETGFKLADKFAARKEKLKEIFRATEEQWNDWHWQVANRITDLETLCKVINLTEEEKAAVERVGSTYRWAISPYYASLMDEDNPRCPIRMQ
ncbi:MAG TPA: lysine 2,3-aminomutase, partial [Firmicutes bacterium]|nr:lysine 2,3-aminomutase [Bacillota bacterium]